MPSDNGEVNTFEDMSLEDIIAQCAVDSLNWFPEKADDMGYMTLCLTGEIGEFANLIKKAIRGSVDSDDEQFNIDLAFELTDIFIYVCMLAGSMGLDLEKMYQIKRKYNVSRFGQEATTEA